MVAWIYSRTRPREPEMVSDACSALATWNMVTVELCPCHQPQSTPSHAKMRPGWRTRAVFAQTSLEHTVERGATEALPTAGQHRPPPPHSLGPPCFHGGPGWGAGAGRVRRHRLDAGTVHQQLLPEGAESQPAAPRLLRPPSGTGPACAIGTASPQRCLRSKRGPAQWSGERPAGYGSLHPAAFTRAQAARTWTARPACCPALCVQAGRSRGLALRPPMWSREPPVKVYLNAVNTLTAMTVRWHVGRLPRSPHGTPDPHAAGATGRALVHAPAHCTPDPHAAGARGRTSQPPCWVNSVTAPSPPASTTPTPGSPSVRGFARTFISPRGFANTRSRTSLRLWCCLPAEGCSHALGLLRPVYSDGRLFYRTHTRHERFTCPSRVMDLTELQPGARANCHCRDQSAYQMANMALSTTQLFKLRLHNRCDTGLRAQLLIKPPPPRPNRRGRQGEGQICCLGGGCDHQSRHPEGTLCSWSGVTRRRAASVPTYKRSVSPALLPGMWPCPPPYVPNCSLIWAQSSNELAKTAHVPGTGVSAVSALCLSLPGAAGSDGDGTPAGLAGGRRTLSMVSM